jgi:membrane-bound lytic murein transglycosylase MltF
VAGKLPENLEDEDLLGMANAGVIKITIVDGYVADFWKQVFPNQWADEGLVTSGF